MSAIPDPLIAVHYGDPSDFDPGIEPGESSVPDGSAHLQRTHRIERRRPGAVTPESRSAPTLDPDVKAPAACSRPGA